MMRDQRLVTLRADFRYQIGCVVGYVARQMIIAGGALGMAVVLIESQLWVSADRSVMPSVVLPLVMPPATNTWQSGIAFPNVGVKGLLSLFCEVAEGFN